MQFILSEQVVLRGYRDMPYAYYFRGCGNAKEMTPEEYDIAKEMYIPCPEDIFKSKPEVCERLLRLGIMKQYQGDGAVQAYQIYRYCDNYYTPSVNWAITGKCNYNCLHCFNAKDLNAINDEFTYEQAIDLLDQFEACGIMNITLTGGEPTLYNNFSQLIQRIDEKGMFLSEITTNGAYITQELLDQLSNLSTKPLFKVSFDGLGEHDWLRNRQGCEKVTLDKIDLLKSNHFNIQIQTNVHKKNMDAILKTALYFDDLGVDYMRIIRTSESPRWEKNGAGLSLSIPEYYEFGIDFAKQYADLAKNMQVYLWQTIALNPKQKEYCHSTIKTDSTGENKKTPVCEANKNCLAITPSGEAVPCNQMSGWLTKHHISFGNVHTTPLADILGDSAYMDVVNYTVDRLYENIPNICGVCQYRKACLGGCRACAILLGDCDKQSGAHNQDVMSAYYINYDALKCLYFKEYKNRFDVLMKQKGWRCEHDFV